MSNIAKNLAEVLTKIEDAARRAGRSPGEVHLVAVSKTRTEAEIRQAVEAGVRDLGENRVQELRQKVQALGPVARWHLVGTLQTNKVRHALECAYLIHSLDRWSLAEELAKEGEKRGITPRCLVEVNTSGEASKHGLEPEEVIGFLQRVAALGSIEVLGLMTIGPLAGDPRPCFRRLRRLQAEAAALDLPRVTMQYLSMGMSGDYEIAIEEGSNMVRVGTAIFGPRPY